MTEEERVLIKQLVDIPYVASTRVVVSKEEFLNRFRETKDGKVLVNELLREALESKSPEDVEAALIVGAAFQYTAESLPILLKLLAEEWHYKHEDLAFCISKFKSPSAVAALYHVTQWIPDYLAFDSGRSLAVKAIWGLGAIAAPEAKSRLIELSESEDEVIRENALKQLSRRTDD